ncbi:MAG TPA: hypothetical protein VL967_07525 [Terracidiphilus sp.]|nr:hypothetical protein [Terracidiphilus sp.]
MANAESEFAAANKPILVTENYIVEGQQCVDADGNIGWLAESLGVQGPKRSFWIVDGTMYGAGIVESAEPGHLAVEIYGEARRVEPQRETDVLRAIARWTAEEA